jgi:orotate phosphoribosyltransferase
MSLEREAVFSMFRESGALLEGHFRLTSGLHSNQYFQCARVLQFPRYCTLLCGDIAGRFTDRAIDVVVSPALGGIVVGQEVGRQLGVRTLFTERSEGVMQLRRGFLIAPGERVLVCEDVVTTGGSVGEVLAIVRNAGGVVAGVASIVDRSGGKVVFPLDEGGLQYPVMTIEATAYAPEQCPLCREGLPIVKPGSRETGVRKGPA